MIERYAVLSGRIRQELADVERTVERAERAASAARRPSEDQDLFLDSAALSLHDFYAGLERIFYHIATTVDRSIPTGQECHRELLRQMGVTVPQIRPAVLSAKIIQSLDEFLGFRHIVRNIYAFEFDPERIERLAGGLRPTLGQVRAELLAFVAFLDELAQEG